jgi:hypothetical protein
VTDKASAADKNHLDGVSGIYRIGQNTVCVELYANKIVDGKLQRVVVMHAWPVRAGSRRSRCSLRYSQR